MTNALPHWTIEHAIETHAAPEALWRIFRDVDGWPKWNAGIERIAMAGPFAKGTTFTMKPPGQDAIESTLVDVRENERFVDETRVGDLVVTVTHRLERLDARRTRVTYALDARGPDAPEIGPAIAADFPEVLAALARLVEGA